MKAEPVPKIPMRLMAARRYARIPVDQIVVINSRDRDQGQFEDNVRNIGAVGLLKPVIVNVRFLERTGKYELVCGEGRLIACKRLGKTEVQAEVIDVDRKQAYLMGLVENIARVPPGTIWFAREVLRMKQQGISRQEIARIVSRSESYVDAYIRLAEDGEERLLRGVERGVFNMSFAIRVVEAGSGEIQNVLMDAFDAGMVNSANFMQVKRILATRLERKARPSGESGSSGSRNRPVKYTVRELQHDIARVTREKESYVREAEHKENRLFALSGALEALMKEPEFVALLAGEGLDARPQLTGKYGAWAGGERGMEGGPRDGQGG